MMLQLEIHIPENGPQAAPDDAGNAAPPSFLWCLRGEQGNVQRSGKSTLESMPSAASCQLILPASRVLLSSIKPPAQNRKKFMQALPYAVEDRIMADPESIHVAADEVLENGEMPLAIADRAWLRQTLDTLGNHGLKPQRADVETLRAPWQARSWTLVWRGNGGFVRQGPHNGIPLDGGDATHPPAALQMALAASDSQPDSIQLYLDGVGTPDLDAWSAELGIPVILSGTWPWPAPLGKGINLLHGEFAVRSSNANWLPRLRPALILAGVILSLQVAFTIGDWAMLKYEKYRLNSAMEQTFRKAFPEAKVIVDAPLQMRRNLAELRHNAGIADKNDFLPLLAQVAPTLGTEARVLSLEYQQEQLKIRLTMANQAVLESLKAKLPQARITPGNSGPGGLEAELSIGK